MAVRTTRWTPNGGTCFRVMIGESNVSFIADGQNDYARNQRPPMGYSDEFLENLATKAVNALESDPEARMLYKWNGPGRILGGDVSGRYRHSETKKDCAGNPAAYWERRVPLRCGIEISLPDREVA